MTHAVVHRILWEYLCAISMIDDEAEQEKLRRDIFDRYCTIADFSRNETHSISCQESLAEMVHTKDGSRVVREFLVRGSAKVRHLALLTMTHDIDILGHTGPKTNTQGPQTSYRTYVSR